MINAEYVRGRLQYDPETGVFIWKPRIGDKSWNIRHSGKAAGTIANNGYRLIKIDNKVHMAARLAWLIVYGEWPINEIDHINRNRNDDRIVNLRDITHTENCNNKVNNNKFPDGVYWDTRREVYVARIPQSAPIFGWIYLGQYGDPIVAGKVVQEGVDIICDNENANEENIKKLLKKLKDLRTEIKSKKNNLPKGVYYNKAMGKFVANIWRNDKNVYLGSFNTPKEASEAYKRALSQQVINVK
jgi:hypothetical protein